MDIYHILKYLAMIFQKYQVFGEILHNSQLIVLTDYTLLFKGEQQVEVCFIAHHEWIALQCNEPLEQ